MTETVPANVCMRHHKDIQRENNDLEWISLTFLNAQVSIMDMHGSECRVPSSLPKDNGYTQRLLLQCASATLDLSKAQEPVNHHTPCTTQSGCLCAHHQKEQSSSQRWGSWCKADHQKMLSSLSPLHSMNTTPICHQHPSANNHLNIQVHWHCPWTPASILLCLPISLPHYHLMHRLLYSCVFGGACTGHCWDSLHLST